MSRYELLLLLGCISWHVAACTNTDSPASAKPLASAHTPDADDATPHTDDAITTDGAPTSSVSSRLDASEPHTSEVSPTTSSNPANSTSSSTDESQSGSSSRLRAVPVGTTELELGYWEYLPPNYGAAPAPLLMFTHGASWQGAGTVETLQKLLDVGPPHLISTNSWPDSRPFVVLAPQNPRSGCFSVEDIAAMYEHARANYDIDTKRIYHTGQSCGAIGGWNYLAEHLDVYVTAAVLISGDGRDAFAKAGCNLGKVAIWGLHNENDRSVSSAGTIAPLTELMGCSPTPDVKLTIYPGETAHDAWTKTYDLSAGHDIYSWLLQHQHP